MTPKIPSEKTAGRKLEWIISREGDANGERRKPYYLAQLIAEAIRAEWLTLYCQIKSDQIEYERTKKEMPTNKSARHFPTKSYCTTLQTGMQ
jgi:hypothetical protein